MDKFDNQELCMNLLKADSEADVVRILSDCGLWQREECWRPLGGDPNNYSSAGNQQSRAEQAIIEKLINAIDTKLTSACRVNGINPESSEAPDTMWSAQEKFFGGEMKDQKGQEKLSRSICVSATGFPPREGRPSFTIVDDGEGQSPRKMHETILSLHAGNKKKIRFVQGKFNMGGTGVLEFCGTERNVQLVISKRNPNLMSEDDPTAHLWSFTVIRRDDPDSPGGTSKFVYLAPAKAEHEENKGGLLSFEADTLPIFPEQNKAYSKNAQWGTLFKLYEYESKRFATHILRDGLMDRVRVLLPEPVLPIRFHECRSSYKGHEGSYDTSMVGLTRTLLDDYDSDKRNNVEWHDRLEFHVNGEKFSARLFLFKDKKAADGYRKDEGVVFSYNGQSHATRTKDFFRRKHVKQDYLWHSLLTVVDCSEVGPRAHEKLFMNSRDRLRDTKLTRDLLSQIESLLAQHDELRQIANERRKREVDTDPVAQESIAKLIADLIKNDPILAKSLGAGTRIQDPHGPDTSGDGRGSYEGQRFPSHFRFKGHEDGFLLVRDAHLKSHCRITFATNAENEYFKREDEPGQFSLSMKINGDWSPVENYQQPRLYNGYAHLTLDIPSNAVVGDTMEFKATLSDPSRVESIENHFKLHVKPPLTKGSNGGGKRNGRTNQDGNEISGGPNDGNQSNPLGLDIPDPTPVRKAQWEEHDPPFDKYTGLRIKSKPSKPNEYDYFVNMDNVFLQQFLASRPNDAETLKLRYKVTLVLVALSHLHQENLMEGGQTSVDFPNPEIPLADRVQPAASAFALSLFSVVESVSKIEAPREELSDSAGGDV